MSLSSTSIDAPPLWRRWALAARPKTLTVAVAPVLVGSTLAALEVGHLSWPVLAAALLAAVAIQVGTNLHNDAADFLRGADHVDTRLGPLRAAASGWLSAEAIERAAWLSFAVAILLGLYLTWVGGWPIVLIGLLSVLAGIAYTGGPRPLAYLGLGELFVLIFFGLVAVAGSYYLQALQVSGLSLLAGLMIGLPAVGVLLVNNYRDADNDRLAGKLTLAVRFGRRPSQVAYAVSLLGPFAMLPAMHGAGDGGLGWLLPLPLLPGALALSRQLRPGTPPERLNHMLGATARLQLGFGLLLCLGLLVLNRS